MMVEKLKKTQVEVRELALEHANILEVTTNNMHTCILIRLDWCSSLPQFAYQKAGP
jgi:hypothetical protein